MHVYFDTDTQYICKFSGKSTLSSRKTTLKTTDKRLKTMKNERETYLVLVEFLSLVFVKTQINLHARTHERMNTHTRRHARTHTFVRARACRLGGLCV